MLRSIAVSYLLVHLVAAALSGDDLFNDIYQNISSATTNPKCDNVVGDGVGCYDCYHCSEEKVRIFIERHKIKTEFQSNTNCGINNPEGYPRRVRESLRSVLPAEYPWRAWIYSKTKPEQPLCAAVYIDMDTRALLVPATCVHSYQTDDLLVSFTKNFDDSHQVQRVILNRHYNKETRYFDIAIVALSYGTTLPKWVKQVCLPETNVSYATPCITVSSDDMYSNAIIPQQSNCAADDIPLDKSFLCTVSSRYDYEGEFGGALMCAEGVNF
ncbi:unnamed protein product [Euphydryas editha]|uniref:Peptidase S1 domain-containing protein n=1 Tax=Euphydryas editha TaxID=104508 RepID=A0AAU9UT02_EUPED|nr:unnamed protein product [Euphydryas editha]